MTTSPPTASFRLPDAAEWEVFLSAHRLPASYRDDALHWFLPLAQHIADTCSRQCRPQLVAINGSQGSGKSTLGACLSFLLSGAGLRSVSVSLDDFYLTREARRVLADTVHPLLATRGVPGTHDTTLMSRTLLALLGRSKSAGCTIMVPSFDKARDDRTSVAQWASIAAPVDVVIWEGWCLGASPQSLAQLVTPINTLEALQDTDGRWRRYVNDALEQHYQPLFAQVDRWVMLAAPAFDTVYRWRLQQEHKLAARTDDSAAVGLMSDADIAQFIAFYQRLTEWCLEDLPARVHWCYRLDSERAIKRLEHPLAHAASESPVKGPQS